MQFAKPLRFLLLLSLMLGVFGGELGESTRLADDVSNDFVPVLVPRIHKRAEIASGASISSGRIATEELVPYLAIVAFTKPLRLSSASDVLRLISVQRK